MEMPEWTGMVEIIDQTRKKFLSMEETCVAIF